MAPSCSLSEVHTPFTFSNAGDALLAGGQRFEVTPDAGSKRALLQWYAVALSFPAYFGYNFDALEECLCDLSWLPAGRIVLYHSRLPLLESDQANERELYLRVLAAAVRHWQRARGRELLVAFHPDCAPSLQALML